MPSEALQGYSPMWRLKAGEFRIIYVLDGNIIQVQLIGKRNDDKIDKALARALRK